MASQEVNIVGRYGCIIISKYLCGYIGKVNRKGERKKDEKERERKNKRKKE